MSLRPTARHFPALAVVVFCGSHFSCTHHAAARAPIEETPFVLSASPNDAGAGDDDSAEEPAARGDRPPPSYPDGAAPILFGNGRRVILRDVDAAGTWPVTIEQAERANAGVEQQLRAQVPRVAAKLSGYRGQFFGYTDDSGTQLVYLNFFCPQATALAQLDARMNGGDPRMYDDRWMTKLEDGHGVRDGDPDCYFNLAFDPATNAYGPVNVGRTDKP
jgi:hypothetical protein